MSQISLEQCKCRNHPVGLNAINVVSSCFRFVWQSKAVSYTSYGGVVPHNMQDLLFIWPCLVGCKNLDTKALKTRKMKCQDLVWFSEMPSFLKQCFTNSQFSSYRSEFIRPPWILNLKKNWRNGRMFRHFTFFYHTVVHVIGVLLTFLNQCFKQSGFKLLIWIYTSPWLYFKNLNRFLIWRKIYEMAGCLDTFLFYNSVCVDL